MKRGDVMTITLTNAVMTGDGIEAWTARHTQAFWDKPWRVAIQGATGDEDLSGEINVRYLGLCSGPNNITVLLFDRSFGPLENLTVTHHQSWPF